MNRIRLGATRLVLLLLPALAGFACSDAVARADAAMFKGDPQLSGVYDAPSPLRLKGVRYTFAAAGPIRSTPAIVDGTLYVGSADGSVYALDAQTGRERWRVPLGAGVSASPCVAEGTVFVTSRDGKLHALSSADGRHRWSVDLGKDLGLRNYWDFYTSSPVAFGADLYVGSGDGRVRAVDRRSGRIKWTFDAGSRVRSTPAVTDGAVVFGTMSGHVVAVDRKSGAQLWKFTTAGASRKFEEKQNDTTSVYGSPSIADGVVTIGGRDGQIYGIDLASGVQKWRTTHDGGSWILGNAAQSGVAYIASGSAALVQAADLKSGAERWRFATSSAVFSSLTIAGGVVLFNDFAGKLYALDKASGAELWRFPLGDRAFSTPVVAGHIVYASSDEGTLYALDVSDEAVAARPPVKRFVYWEPRRDDDSTNFRNDVDVVLRSSFEIGGYERVDATELATAVGAQIADPAQHSVIVFAANRVPPVLLEPASAEAPLRKFLEAGGRIVFVGINPVANPEKILGLRYPPLENERGYHVAQATAEGKTWGLRGEQVVNGAIDPGQVSAVLANNEFGLATSWVKRYGRRGGTLLQLTAPTLFVGSLTSFVIAAEHGL
jgi:outer membrane protein assembly factor BamB